MNYKHRLLNNINDENLFNKILQQDRIVEMQKLKNKEFISEKCKSNLHHNCTSNKCRCNCNHMAN